MLDMPEPAGPGTQYRPAAVEDGGPQVREYARLLPQPVPVAVQAEEGVLYHVLGGRLVPDQQQGEPGQGQRMGLVQLLDRVACPRRVRLAERHVNKTTEPRVC